MKLAVTMYSLNNSYRKGETNIEDFINFCGTLEIQGVDLLSYYWKDRKAEIKKVPNLLKKNNLVLAAYATGNNFIQEDKVKIKEEIKRVKQEIDTAAELKAPLMRIFGGSFVSAEREVRPRGPTFATHTALHRVGDGGSLAKEKTRKDAVDIVIEPIKECVDYAKNKGVILALENHGIPGTSQELKHILDSINSPFLRATVDIGNFLSLNQDPQEAVEELISYAVHVHLKDISKKGSSEQSILGEGIIDLETILRIFDQSGYDGFFSLEHEMAGDEKQGIRKSISYAKKILREISS